MSGGQIITIPVEFWTAMAVEADRLVPQEGCGLLAGVAGIVKAHYPIPNVLSSPVRFRMEAQSQVRAFLDMETRNLQLLAIWHSHPMGPALPSPTDLAEHAYPGVVHLIWTKKIELAEQAGLENWGARGFLLDNAVVCEVLLRVE